MNIAVIGIGQSLRGDDGIGPATIRQWSLDFPATASNPRVKTILLETPGLDLLDCFEGSDSVILVDAICTGRPAGTIQVIMSLPESGLSAAEKTAHGFGVAESISVARKTGMPLPERLILIGIEGRRYDLGSGLSDPVRAAIPDAAARIQEKVIEFLSTKSTKPVLDRPGGPGET
jgi:hydrogenase maturation protease